MYELKKITKRYGALSVYENFDLTLEEGKITCILGESGCGKTTLLNILAGTTDFTGEAPKLSCSYIFQQPRLVPNLTVHGNLRLICRDEKKIEDMLERVGLADKRNAYPVELSGGQSQRVSIARAFLHPSELILMDEPFSSLDTALKIRLIDEFSCLWREERRTAVFVTHDAEEAYMLSHRAIVLKNGKIIADIRDESEIPRVYGRESFYKKQILSAMLNDGIESKNI